LGISLFFLQPITQTFFIAKVLCAIYRRVNAYPKHHAGCVYVGVYSF